MPYAHDIANARLQQCLKENAKLVQHVKALDTVVRAVCAELDVCYCGVDSDKHVIVQAIQTLKL